MIITAIVGMITGLIHTPSGVVGKIPSITPTFGAAFEAFKDPSQLFTIQFLIVILTFFFIDFFDTAGTLVAVATQAGIMKDNKLLEQVELYLRLFSYYCWCHFWYNNNYILY